MEEIESSAFRDCASLTSVVIPDSVKEIGMFAFQGCSRLASVKLPEGITGIDCEVFESSGLTSIVIPDGVTLIYRSFFDCKKLTSVVIPDSVTSIREFAFKGCLSLTSIVIPEGVTEIGEMMFEKCTSLTSVVIPDTVTSIGPRAFKNCISLTSVVIPKGVTAINEETFFRCTSLTSVVIPDSVTTIGRNAFYGCTSLTSIVIPDSVTTIRDNAFDGCVRLASVVIPDSVTEIGDNAFDGCISLPPDAVPEAEGAGDGNRVKLINNDHDLILERDTEITGDVSYSIIVPDGVCLELKPEPGRDPLYQPFVQYDPSYITRCGFCNARIVCYHGGRVIVHNACGAAQIEQYGGEVVIGKYAECHSYRLRGGKLTCRGHIAHCLIEMGGPADDLLTDCDTRCAYMKDGAVVDKLHIDESNIYLMPGSEVHNFSMEDYYTEIHIYKDVVADGNIDCGMIYFHDGATLPPGLRLRRELGGSFSLYHEP